MPNEDQPVGQLRPVSNKIINENIKPIGKLRPIGETILTPIKDFGSDINSAEKANSIIDDLPEMPGDTESKKSLLKDLVSRGGTKEDISESILTLQGKHPKQDGGYKYYMDDKGVARPLANSERPPKGYDVASLWGNQKEAEDDNIVTSTAKHLWNGLLGAAEGAVSLPETIYGLATGDDSTTAQTLKNAAQYLKFNTKSSEKEQLFNTEGMKQWEDILDPARWTPTGNNIQGQILNGLESVISFAVGRGLGTSKVVSKGGQKALTAISAYNMSLNSMLDSADDAGLTGRDKYAFAAVASVPQAALEGFTGVGGLLTKNAAAKAEFQNLARIAAQNLERDAAGNLTKESLEKLTKEMTVASASVAKKYAGQVAKTVGEEAGTETLQQIAEESSKQLYDKLKEDPAFHADAFSPESAGKYINAAIGGALGSIGPSIALNQQKSNITKEKEQSENVFEIVKKGDEAIKSFKQNVANNVKDGNLTPEQAKDANLRVDAYQKYHTEIAPLNVKDNEKKQAFELTFQKENLHSQMEALGNKEKLSPIQLGIYDGLEKQARDIQKDINEIILKGQLNKPDTTVVGKKTLEDEIKKENKPEQKEGEKKPVIPEHIKTLQNLHEKYKTDNKSYKDTPKEEYNSDKYPSRLRHAKLAEHLESLPDKKLEGELTERKYIHGNKEHSTFAVKLKDGKFIKLASSIERPEKFRGHMRTEHLINEKELEGFPVGVKLEYLPEGKKVIKLYNGKTGKFVSWAKETHRGLEKPSDAQIEQLEHLQTQIEPPLKGFEQDVNSNPTQPITDLNVQQNNEESTITEPKSETGSVEESINKAESKAKKLTVGTKKHNRIPRKPETIRALNHDVFTPHALALQYFIGGGNINRQSILKLFKGSHKEANHRVSYIKADAPTIEQVAEHIVNAHEELGLDMQDVVNAVEEVVTDYHHYSPMAKDLNNVMDEGERRFNPNEEVINQEYDEADKNGVSEEFDNYVDALEGLSDEQLTELADEQKSFDEWFDVTRAGSKELYVEHQIKALKERNDSDFDKELETSGFYTKFFSEQYDRLNGQFQKQSSIAGNVHKVFEHIRKALPNIRFKYDDNLAAAGKISADGKTITINPNWAGIDTPIHEAGHVLIDAMGYNHPTIQKAIKQLEKSKLWKETKAKPAYAHLSNEMLGKEVLAEAIGREGAGIFEKESNISKFQKLLDKIFQWFKDYLGLERNEAKKLAKEILRGEHVDLTGTDTGIEQLQKESSLADDLRQVNEYLKGDLTPEEKSYAEEIKANILDSIQESPELERIDEVADAKTLEGFTLDELIEVYNDAINLGEYKSDKITALKQRIAYFMNEHGKEILKKNDKFIEAEANKKDLSWKDVNFKVLSHMTQDFPELQQLSPMFDEAYFNKISEANTMKRSLEKKAKAVIKEHNKKLGIGERALGFFSSDNAKYFEYLDDNGQLRDNTSGLSTAQIELLNHMKDLLEKRNKQVDENGDLTQNDILKIDKGFAEAFKTEGIMSALSNYFGGSNLADTQITYTNPTTKQEEHTSYLDAQKSILEYSKAGLKEKVIGLAKLLSIAYKAKKGSGKSAYALNYKGQLTNKFDKPRNKDLGYSKDFYRAAQMFIDDYTHVKHFSKFVPIVNSLDYLYSQGYGEVLKKPNAKKWLDEWSQAQIYQTEKTTDPILDASLKFLRTLTSQIVMGFNLSANIMNVFIGNYNSWRSENSVTLLKGNKRLFGKDNLNKYGLDLLNRYHVVNLDVDSNPGYTAGKLFQQIAFAGQKYGELQIQGSVFLGKLSDAEWNSFEYNEDGELVPKENVDESELIKKFNTYKNEISDVQGKYSDKDRRNFARGELGKNVQQFKTYLPDWWKIRLGSEYIDGNGVTKRGSWRGYTGDALKELKADIKRDGIKGFWNNKQAMENLKGAMFLGFMLALVYGDDDDKKKKHEALSLDNALGNLTSIFSPEQLKYMLQNPTASIGTVTKFVKILEDVIAMDADRFEKDAKKVIPYNKIADVPKQVEQISNKLK